MSYLRTAYFISIIALFSIPAFWGCGSGGDGNNGTPGGGGNTPPINNLPAEAVLGIFSETASEALKFDVDSTIGTIKGKGGSLGALVQDTTDVKEGSFSMRATLSVNAASEDFAGWYVGWGDANTIQDDTVVKDMSSFRGGSLKFWVKTPVDLEVGIRSGDVVEGNETSNILLSQLDFSVKDNSWRQICVPLSAFEGAAPKADLNKVKVFFVMSSNTLSGGTGGEQKNFFIDDVRWSSVNCSDDHGDTINTATSIQSNSSMIGSLRGGGDVDLFRLDLSSDGVIRIHTTGSTNTVGRLLDAAGQELAADDDNGPSQNFGLSNTLVAGTYFVEVSGFQGTAVGAYTLLTEFISGNNPQLPKVLGVFSETAFETLNFDIDSFLGTFKGGGAIFDPLVQDRLEVKEGSFSMQATVSVNASAGDFAGWFVSWGDASRVADDAFVKDMTSFKGGSLTFWVKTPMNLEVGIRSGSVLAGNETSKVLLNQFDPSVADNSWRKICVPISSFEGPAPNADLSKTKVFFVIASNKPSGGTGGTPKTFWIDDVRWSGTICP